MFFWGKLRWLRKQKCFAIVHKRTDDGFSPTQTFVWSDYTNTLLLWVRLLLCYQCFLLWLLFVLSAPTSLLAKVSLKKYWSLITVYSSQLLNIFCSLITEGQNWSDGILAKLLKTHSFCEVAPAHASRTIKPEGCLAYLYFPFQSYRLKTRRGSPVDNIAHQSFSIVYLSD